MSALVASLLEKIETRRARAGVVGLGYVGLPLAVELAKAGFRTTGIDLDARKIRAIMDGESYIPDVPAADVKGLRKAGTLDATTDFSVVKELDTINICVPTPLRKTKDPDMSYIVSAVESIAEHLHPGMLISLESTTYPGTTDEVVQPLLEAKGLKAGKDFFLAFSPERVDPGNPTFHTRNVPKVVGGLTPDCLRLATALYGSAIDTIVPVASTRVAEMVKLLENTFRAVNIGLVNELALMCDRMNIDVWEVVDAAKTKPFGFMAFYPGPGLGGHCIPIDPFYLSWKAKQSGFDPRFIELAGHINASMPHYVVEKIGDALEHQTQIDQRRQHPDRRRRLQARHRRHARVTGARRHGPPVCEGRARRLRRSLCAGRARTRVVGQIRRQCRGGEARIVCRLRLCSHHHGPQNIRLRRDGRRSRPGCRYEERNSQAGSECVQAGRRPPRSAGRKRRHRIGTPGATALNMAEPQKAMETLFWVSVLLVAYVYAGYPMVLGLWAWIVNRPVRKRVPGPGEPWPAVSVVLAAHDEAQQLRGRIANLLDQNYPGRLEVIVVSDGSEDDTSDVLAWFGDRIRAVELPRGGKPTALNAGVSAATGEIIVFADARQRFAEDAIYELVANFADGDVGGVSGELILDCEYDEAPSDSTIGGGVGLYWKYEKWLRRHESRVWSTLGATGAIYALRRSLWTPLPAGHAARRRALADACRARGQAHRVRRQGSRVRSRR